MKFQELVDAKKAKVQSDFDSKIANIEAQAVQLKADAEAVKVASLDAIEEVVVAVEAYGKEREDIGYDKGQADAGVPADDKKYTEADLQAELALKEQAVKDSFLPVINKLNLLEKQVQELEASIPLKVEQAIEDFKASLLVAAQEQKAAEDQTEFAFMDLLKPKSV